jgi:cation transporter-like permease
MVYLIPAHLLIRSKGGAFAMANLSAATQDRAPEAATPQYSLAKILSIWAAAAVPMAILGWTVAPALAPDIASDPIGAAVFRVGLLTMGLIWQFVLSMIIVYRFLAEEESGK